MTTFALIPGAGGVAWYWHRVTPLLESAGHRAVAVDLPGDDPRAGLSAYADVVVRAIGDASDVIVVAQSLGGFTAPLVCERTKVRLLVLLNAMIPLPGETAGAWWANTGSDEACVEAAQRHGYSADFDVHTYFLHDVPEDIWRSGESKQRDESEAAFREPCRFRSWDGIPRRVLAGSDDRFFPVEFQRRVASERLGDEIDEVPGGHLVALSRPEALVAKLTAYAAERHRP